MKDRPCLKCKKNGHIAWQCLEKARGATSTEEEASDPLAMCMMHEATVSHNFDSESIDSGNSSVKLGEINETGNSAIIDHGGNAIITHDRPTYLKVTRPRVDLAKGAPKFCASFGSSTCCSECEDSENAKLDAF